MSTDLSKAILEALNPQGRKNLIDYYLDPSFYFSLCESAVYCETGKEDVDLTQKKNSNQLSKDVSSLFSTVYSDKIPSTLVGYVQSQFKRALKCVSTPKVTLNKSREKNGCHITISQCASIHDKNTYLCATLVHKINTISLSQLSVSQRGIQDIPLLDSDLEIKTTITTGRENTKITSSVSHQNNLIQILTEQILKNEASQETLLKVMKEAQNTQQADSPIIQVVARASKHIAPKDDSDTSDEEFVSVHLVSPEPSSPLTTVSFTEPKNEKRKTGFIIDLTKLQLDTTKNEKIQELITSLEELQRNPELITEPSLQQIQTIIKEIIGEKHAEMLFSAKTQPIPPPNTAFFFKTQSQEKKAYEKQYANSALQKFILHEIDNQNSYIKQRIRLIDDIINSLVLIQSYMSMPDVDTAPKVQQRIKDLSTIPLLNRAIKDRAPFTHIDYLLSKLSLSEFACEEYLMQFLTFFDLIFDAQKEFSSQTHLKNQSKTTASFIPKENEKQISHFKENIINFFNEPKKSTAIQMLITSKNLRILETYNKIALLGQKSFTLQDVLDLLQILGLTPPSSPSQPKLLITTSTLSLNTSFFSQCLENLIVIQQKDNSLRTKRILEEVKITVQKREFTNNFLQLTQDWKRYSFESMCTLSQGNGIIVSLKDNSSLSKETTQCLIRCIDIMYGETDKPISQWTTFLSPRGYSSPRNILIPDVVKFFNLTTPDFSKATTMRTQLKDYLNQL